VQKSPNNRPSLLKKKVRPRKVRLKNLLQKLSSPRWNPKRTKLTRVTPRTKKSLKMLSSKLRQKSLINRIRRTVQTQLKKVNLLKHKRIRKKVLTRLRRMIKQSQLKMIRIKTQTLHRQQMKGRRLIQPSLQVTLAIRMSKKSQSRKTTQMMTWQVARLLAAVGAKSRNKISAFVRKMRIARRRLSAALISVVLTHRSACMGKSSSKMCARSASSACLAAVSIACAHTSLIVIRSVVSILSAQMSRRRAARKATVQTPLSAKEIKCLATRAPTPQSARATTATKAI